MKRCVTCHVVKPLTEFNIRRAAKDGRQDRCRDCFKAWYRANRAEHQVNVHRRNAAVQAELRSRLAEYLKEHPCVDCGCADIRVLELDHREPRLKRAGVGLLLIRTLSWRVVQAEIAKCDVRCCNCHRRRSAEQLGWWRSVVLPAD